MDERDKLRLSVRTIVVTTRAAVRGQREAGNDRTASAAALRGLTMLEELNARLPENAPADVQRLVNAGRAELIAMADGAPVTHARTLNEGEPVTPTG